MHLASQQWGQSVSKIYSFKEQNHPLHGLQWLTNALIISLYFLIYNLFLMPFSFFIELRGDLHYALMWGKECACICMCTKTLHPERQRSWSGKSMEFWHGCPVYSLAPWADQGCILILKVVWGLGYTKRVLLIWLNWQTLLVHTDYTSKSALANIIYSSSRRK